MKDYQIMKKVFSIIYVGMSISLFLLVILSYVNVCILRATSEHIQAYDGRNEYVQEIAYRDYRKQVNKIILNETLNFNTDAFPEDEQKRMNVFESLISHIKEVLESYTTVQGILFNEFFIESKKLIDKSLGLDMTASSSYGKNNLFSVSDIVVKTDEEQLAWVQDDTDISEPLDNLLAFGIEMKNEGRNFLYFQTPNKYASSSAFTDYSDKYYKIVKDSFEKYNLDIYHVADEMKQMGMSQKDIFYNTDHHWKPSSGILADKLLCAYLNSSYGYNIDTSNLEIDRYEKEAYDDFFLGSLGKRVSTVYALPDDFVIYYPKYNTNLSVFNSYDSSNKTGRMEEVLFNYAQIDKRDLYNKNPYGFYGYGDLALLEVHNNLVNDGSHIMLIKTSFADCMIPYLATVVEDMEVVDLRYFKGSVRKYINEKEPDTIIVVSGLSAMEKEFVEDSTFDFR